MLDTTVLEIDAEDEPGYPLLALHFEQVGRFIDEMRSQERPVLVHCFAGMNRSATLCAAYLITRERMGLLEACRVLGARRGAVLKNEDFVGQLVQLARWGGVLLPPDSLPAAVGGAGAGARGSEHVSLTTLVRDEAGADG